MKLMPVATLSSKPSVVSVSNLDCGREATLVHVDELTLLVAKVYLFVLHLLLLFWHCRDLAFGLLLARLLLLLFLFILGCVSLQLVVYKVLERLQVSLSLVLLSLQVKTDSVSVLQSDVVGGGIRDVA